MEYFPTTRCRQHAVVLAPMVVILDAQDTPTRDAAALDKRLATAVASMETAQARIERVLARMRGSADHRTAA